MTPDHVKTDEQHIQHFLERVGERYGITMTLEEFNDMKGTFKGLVKLSERKTIGSVTIQGQEVYVLYVNYKGLFVTAYPKTIAEDPDSAIKACFPVPLRNLAKEVYNSFEQEVQVLSTILPHKKFDHSSDLVNYLVGISCFPYVHLGHYKTKKVPIFKLMRQIRNILDVKNGDVFLQLKLKKRY